MALLHDLSAKLFRLPGASDAPIELNKPRDEVETLFVRLLNLDAEQPFAGAELEGRRKENGSQGDVTYAEFCQWSLVAQIADMERHREELARALRKAYVSVAGIRRAFKVPGSEAA